MKTRIKAIRNEFRISQSVFGKRIGITPASVSLLESGRNSPSEQTLRLILAQFPVNEEWLRTGAGEMLAQRTLDSTDQINALLGQNSDPFIRDVIVGMLRLTPEQQTIFRDFVVEIVEAHKARTVEGDAVPTAAED
jgi:transcriptional regulator with XRE-family HTH domain